MPYSTSIQTQSNQQPRLRTKVNLQFDVICSYFFQVSRDRYHCMMQDPFSGGRKPSQKDPSPLNDGSTAAKAQRGSDGNN